MNVLPKLLSELQNDNEKYFFINGKELKRVDNNWTILQNDNNSTKIKIILPEILGGFTIDKNFNFYIDFLDGKNKPGVIKNETEVIVKDEQGNILSKETDYTYDIVTNILKINKEGLTGSGQVIDNKAIIAEKVYYVKYNIEIISSKDYNNNQNIVNYEISNNISNNYPNGYADKTYFKKFSKNISVQSTSDNNEQGEKVNYIEITWDVDQQLTKYIGEVEFSIRIENQNGFIWQSSTSSFNIQSNLNDEYYLHKEIEENYIIQNREIKPVGDFKATLIKGDSNSNTLFYKINRYFQGNDLLKEDNEIKKLQNGCFVLNNNYANISYKINNGTLTDSKTGNNFIINEKSQVIIGDTTYTLELYKKFNQGINQYENIIKIKELDTTYIINDQYNGIIKIKEENYNIILINPIATGYIDTLEPIPEEEKILPVFHRSIRFVFLSPNQDYGDWVDAEIEFVNNEYFIFSWTPDNRVTRSAGELSYYIEFFLQDEQQTYSWSTLPATLLIEDNKVGTASSDYLPHWVEYVENQIQDDVQNFMNVDLQSQYDSFEINLLHNIFENYENLIVNQDLDNQYSFNDKDNKYNITVNIPTTQEKEYSFTYTKNDTSIIYPITTKQINNIYYGIIDGIYDFSFEPVFNSVLILKVQTDKNEYRPLVPVFWNELDKIENNYNDNLEKIKDNFNKYEETLQDNFGYQKDEQNNIDLKNNIINNFNTLFSVLNALYNEEKITISGGYSQGVPVEINNGTIIVTIGENKQQFFVSNIDFINNKAKLKSYTKVQINKDNYSKKNLYAYQNKGNQNYLTVYELGYKEEDKGEFIPYQENDVIKEFNYSKQDKEIIKIDNLFICTELTVDLVYKDENAKQLSLQNNNLVLFTLSVKQQIENYKKVIDDKYNILNKELAEQYKKQLNEINSVLTQQINQNLTDSYELINELFKDTTVIEVNNSITTLEEKYISYIDQLNMQNQHFDIHIDNNNDGILHINIK